MQGGKKIVIKNTIFIAGARYINLITTGLLTIFLARYLDIPIFGKYITIFSFLFFANILTNFGIPLIIVRNVARNLKLANLYFFNATFIMLCFSLIAYFIINLIAFLMYNDKELKLLILIASISLFPGVISSTCGAIFRAFERMEIPSLINSFISIFSFFVIILILFTVNKKLFFVILTNVLFSFLNMILIFKKLKKNINLKFEKINYSLCFSILKQSFAVAFIRIFNMINQRIDIIMLSTMSGMANVGFYGVPVRLIRTLNIPFTSLSVALLPRVSIYFNKARSLKNIYKQSQRFYIFLGLIITRFFSSTAITTILRLSPTWGPAKPIPGRFEFRIVSIISFARILICGVTLSMRLAFILSLLSGSLIIFLISWDLLSPIQYRSLEMTRKGI